MNKKKLFKITLLICLSIILASFIIFFRPTFLGGDTRFEPVLSGSMEPSMPVGSIVIIKPIDTQSLKIGDVICYHASDSMLITHRIIEVNEAGFITKGDANEEADLKIVNQKDIVGSAVLSLPFIGYLGSFIRTPIGFTLLLVLPACSAIILEVKTIIKEKRKRPLDTN